MSASDPHNCAGSDVIVTMESDDENPENGEVNSSLLLAVGALAAIYVFRKYL